MKNMKMNNMKKRNKILLFLLAVFVLVLLTEPVTHLLHRTADRLLYNNYHHYVSCADLPTLTEVEAVVAAHGDTVAQIQAVDPADVEFVIDSATCPGKGSIVIYYASHTQSEQIQALLPDKTFYGIPVTLINR